MILPRLEPAPPTASPHERLRAIEETLRAALEPRGFVAPELAGALRHAVFPGGRRWRPLLVLSAAELAGAPWPDALAAAAAVELVHCCSLVFDDLPCMDDADERRGRPATHRRFGEGIATLAGLGLLTTSFGLLARGPRPGRAVALAARYLGPGAMLTGQALDLRGAEASRLGLAPGLLHTVRNGKTSALVRLALQLGALHGRISDRQRRALSAFGGAVGEAYQAADDLQDLGIDARRPGGNPVVREAMATEAALDRHLRRARDLLERAFPDCPARRSLHAFLDFLDPAARGSAPGAPSVAASG